jgi:FRG domain
LGRDHKPGHIYRGQTRFYEPTVPSAFRSFVKEAETDGWVKLHDMVDMPTAPNATYEAERYKIKTAVGRSFNRGLTNLLAQQYGLSSDMFDVTESINVAGFFATRSWPTYQPYIPTKPGEVGVVYRMHSKIPFPTLREFEELTEHYYLLLDTGQKVFFENVRTLSPEAHALIAQFGHAAVLTHEFPEGLQLGTLFKMPFYCRPSMMRRFTVERLNELGFGELVGPGKPFTSTDHAYDSSRIARQAAGVVSPPMRYQGVILASLGVGPRNGDENWLRAEPDKAFSGGLNAVFNLNSNPNFERFFFLHDPTKAIGVKSLDDFWPPRESDPLFDMMAGAVEAYFAEHRGAPNFDPLLILDRGYSKSAA